MTTYHDELCETMAILGKRPNTIFLGQGVGNPGTSMHSTFRDVAPDKLLEMPVAEELQMGMAIGMALEGYLPICVFPRWNFMLRAADQIINHLDRLPLYSDGGYRPRVIIRTAVPSTDPFNPGPQHDDNFSEAFQMMCRTIQVVPLRHSWSIKEIYLDAANEPGSKILVEFTDQYKNERARH